MTFFGKIKHFLNTKIRNKTLVTCQSCGLLYYVSNNKYDVSLSYYCSPHCAINGIATY